MAPYEDPADAFLLGGGGASAKFEQPGQFVRGIVLSKNVRQRTKIGTGEPLWWDEEKTRPQEHLVVQLQTEERDPEIEDDDGIRNLYVKGSKDPKSQSMTAALAAAIKEAGAPKLELGGVLTVQYIGDGERTQRGFNPPKLYRAWFERPTEQYLAQGDPSAGVATPPGVAAPAAVAAPPVQAAPVAAPVAAPPAVAAPAATAPPAQVAPPAQAAPPPVAAPPVAAPPAVAAPPVAAPPAVQAPPVAAPPVAAPPAAAAPVAAPPADSGDELPF